MLLFNFQEVIVNMKHNVHLKDQVNADIVSWNSDFNELKQYKGYVLPGGFSFQDRVRAGVVASKLSIASIIKEEALKGKPILGIEGMSKIETGLLPKNDESSGAQMLLQI